MSVPEDIRKVKRPSNTVVIKTADKGNHMYAVRERKSVKYVQGGNPQPINGKTIGHIINHKFVPKVEKTAPKTMELSYGTAALTNKLSKDIYEDLLTSFSVKDATMIMALASLKMEKPSIKMDRMRSRYEQSFTSVYYPGASLSLATISKFYRKLGLDIEGRNKFADTRINRLSNNTRIIIDSTLKEDNSTVNDLSHYSFKSKVKGTKNISLIYAYNLENKEPFCCEVFPGNHVDSTAYKSFLLNNNITRGIIIDDKGFPVYKINDVLKDHEGLHFLTPIKRNDSRISGNNMLEFDEVIKGIDSDVLAKKKKIKGGRFLYAFKDNYKAFKESRTYIEKNKKGEKNTHIDTKKYLSKKDVFGVIVYESDLDMTCEEAYKCYDSRWEIEMIFRAYKNELMLNTTNVQNDSSVRGVEFINMISSIITKRIVNRFSELNLLKNDTYGNLIEDLNMAWRRVEYPFPDAYYYMPQINDKDWVHTNVTTMDILKKLELCSNSDQEK